MRMLSSSDVQDVLGDVLASAGGEPTVLMNRGEAQLVLLSAAEYRRLKAAAGERVPTAILPAQPLFLSGSFDDPLGYDTSDLRATARRMADDALSGHTAGAIGEERDRVLRRLARPQRTEDDGGAVRSPG